MSSVCQEHCILGPQMTEDKPHSHDANCSERWTDTKHTIPVHDDKNKEDVHRYLGTTRSFSVVNIVT